MVNFCVDLVAALTESQLQRDPNKEIVHGCHVISQYTDVVPKTKLMLKDLTIWIVLKSIWTTAQTITLVAAMMRRLQVHI